MKIDQLVYTCDKNFINFIEDNVYINSNTNSLILTPFGDKI